MKADLHLHSTAQMERLRPDELIALAAELGFTHLADRPRQRGGYWGGRGRRARIAALN